MMKKQTLLNLVIIGISLIGFVYLINDNRRCKRELDRKEKEILKLWDDKIAGYQFLVNANYRDRGWKKDFFKKLDDSYNKLRQLLMKEGITQREKKELIDFLMIDFSEAASTTKEEVLERLKMEDYHQIFVGNNLEIVKRLDIIVNPSFISSHGYIQRFDIWEKQEKWNLNAGDTTDVMIRLLKNYDLRSHQMELVPTENMKIIKPYLGQLRVIIPEDIKEEEKREISFEIYDWISRDTIIKTIHINPNWTSQD